MKKFSKNLIIVFMFFLGCSLFSACFPNKSEMFEYGLKVGDVYYIKSINSKDIENVIIPESYKGKKIVGIDREAFKDCVKLKSIVLPEGVVEIGDDAFVNCTSLETIQLPNSIEKIGVDAFKNCDSLKYYTYQNGYYLGNRNNNFVTLIKGIDNSVETFSVNDNCSVIYSGAFDSFSALKNINMPYSIKNIGYRAFSFCSSLENFTVPNYVKEFSITWFEMCNSLKKITITANVKIIDIPTYSTTCKNLEEFSVYSTNSKFAAKDGVLYSKDLKTLLSYPTGKVGSSFNIPSHVNTLTTYAFNGCDNLTSLSMWPTTENLRSGAVINCKNLHTLSFNGTTTEWIKIDNANLGWDPSFVVNKVKCSNGTLNRSKA